MQLQHNAMRMLKQAQMDPNGPAFAFAALCNAKATSPNRAACVKRCKSTKRNLAQNLHTILAQVGKPKRQIMKANQTWQESFARWQAIHARVTAQGRRIDDATHEKGWALAASVGIPRHMCALHNASIDDELKGWCHQNPQRLKVARQANHLVNDWTASQKAREISKRAWNKLMPPQGAPAQA